MTFLTAKDTVRVSTSTSSFVKRAHSCRMFDCFMDYSLGKRFGHPRNDKCFWWVPERHLHYCRRLEISLTVVRTNSAEGSWQHWCGHASSLKTDTRGFICFLAVPCGHADGLAQFCVLLVGWYPRFLDVSTANTHWVTICFFLVALFKKS